MNRLTILIALVFLFIACMIQTTTFAQILDTPPILPARDSAMGKNLFTGVTPFTNGGPACIACHSIAGISALGGGALGPDLTATVTNFGGDEVFRNILAEFTSPASHPTTKNFTMKPIFTKHPLTPEEQADIRAFMGQAGDSTVRSTGTVRTLFSYASGGAVFLIMIAQLFWMNRSKGVRKQLVNKP